MNFKVGDRVIWRFAGKIDKGKILYMPDGIDSFWILWDNNTKTYAHKSNLTLQDKSHMQTDLFK